MHTATGPHTRKHARTHASTHASKHAAREMQLPFGLVGKNGSLHTPSFLPKYDQLGKPPCEPWVT